MSDIIEWSPLMGPRVSTGLYACETCHKPLMLTRERECPNNDGQMRQVPQPS